MGEVLRLSGSQKRSLGHCKGTVRFMEVNKVPGRAPFWVSINLSNIHMQVLDLNKHVPITKTGHLQGHKRATSGKGAGFCMLK
jgi:hypothetical protein